MGKADVPDARTDTPDGKGRHVRKRSGWTLTAFSACVFFVELNSERSVFFMVNGR